MEFCVQNEKEWENSYSVSLMMKIIEEKLEKKAYKDSRKSNFILEGV